MREIASRPPYPSTYTSALNQSNAFGPPLELPSFPGQVNFRLRAIFLILTLIIGKEDIAAGILGLNGKEDWPWDPTDEMNFQWKPRSRIPGWRSERADESGRETERDLTSLRTPASPLLSHSVSLSLFHPVSSPDSSLSPTCFAVRLPLSFVSHCYCSRKFRQITAGIFRETWGSGARRQERHGIGEPARKGRTGEGSGIARRYDVTDIGLFWPADNSR